VRPKTKTVDRVKPVRKKRISVRAAAKPVKVRAAAGRRKTARRQWSASPRALVLVAGCVVIAVALMAMPRSSGDRIVHVPGMGQVDDIASVIAFAEDVALPAEPSMQGTTARTAVTRTAPPQTSKTAPEPAPKRSVVSAVASTPPPTPESAPEAAPPAASAPRPVAAELVSKMAVPGASTVHQEDTAPVTIAGCLERDDDAFWLKDASGDGAPQKRSWKSGFLKKRPSRIELVGGTYALWLASHVGQRVESTGVLVDREMQVKSLRAQGSCD